MNKLKLNRKVSRIMELEQGRVCHKRIHKNKKKYDRKRNRKDYERFYNEDV